MSEFIENPSRDVTVKAQSRSYSPRAPLPTPSFESIHSKPSLEQPRPAPVAHASDKGESRRFHPHSSPLMAFVDSSILLVLIDHLFVGNDHTGSRVLDFRHGGARLDLLAGVNLFLCALRFSYHRHSHQDAPDVPHYFKTFYSRRALRIFPLYYGFLSPFFFFTKPLHIRMALDGSTTI